MIRYRIRRLLYFTFVAFGEAAIFPAWAICRAGFLLAMNAYPFYYWLVY